jgi:hypothetical protein
MRHSELLSKTTRTNNQAGLSGHESVGNDVC